MRLFCCVAATHEWSTKCILLCYLMCFRVICEWVIFVGGACVRKLLSTNLVGGDISLIYEHVDLLKKLGIKLNKAFTYCAFWYYDGVLWNMINKRVPKITDDLRFRFKVRFYFFSTCNKKWKKILPKVTKALCYDVRRTDLLFTLNV